MIKLPPDRRNDIGVRVANLVGTVAMEVHEPTALGIDQVNPLTMLNSIEARCRKGLPQESNLVGGQQLGGLGIDVILPPATPPIASIDITLGAE